MFYENARSILSKTKKREGEGGGGEIIKIAGEEGVMECQREQRNIR